MIRHSIVDRSAVPRENRRIKGETLAKILLLVVTGTGLFYQATIIFQQFMSGKTVVRLKIGNYQDQTPPAITICIPSLFSMERSANISENFTKIYENYTKLLKNNSLKAIKYYWDIFNLFVLNQLKNNGLNMTHLFDKMSVKYKNLAGQNNILIDLYGDMDNNTLPGEFSITITKIIKMFSVKGYPMESILILQNKDQIDSVIYGKCWTFFSQAQEKWRNFHAQIEQIFLFSTEMLFIDRTYSATSIMQFILSITYLVVISI